MERVGYDADVSSIVRSSMLHPNSIFRLNVITFKREPSSMKDNQGLSLAARCDILDEVLVSTFGHCSLHSNALPAPRRETNTTPYAATPKKSAWRRVSPLLSVIVRKASLKTRQSPKTTAAQSETPVMESPETATVESPETATVESPEAAMVESPETATD
jgi:hypothetical protein